MEQGRHRLYHFRLLWCEVFKIDEELGRACDNYGSFLNSRKHEMLNDLPRQSTDTMDSTYQT